MKRFDAVEMVRKVRDEEYEKTRNMSREDWLRYLKETGRRAMERFRGRARTATP